METFREEGNEYYKKEQYTSAITRYQKGLNFLEKWPKKFEDDLTAIRAKKESLLALSTNKA
jgi:prefoldin subunit 5